MMQEPVNSLAALDGAIVVVKLGGAAMATGRAIDFLNDVAILRGFGVDVVVVHGGGPEITQWQQRLGIEPHFVDGLRVSDAATIELARMILTGKVGPELVSSLHQLGVNAVGISGEDGPTIMARPHRPDDNLGFVGEVVRVETGHIRAVLDNGRVPVIASIGIDDVGQAYNINADTAAAEIAVALDAAVLVLVTDIPGVRDRDGMVISDLDAGAARALIADGTATDGMIPKLEAALRGVDTCARSVIVDGAAEHTLISALIPGQGGGTTIRREPS